jgi:hypothetical protein
VWLDLAADDRVRGEVLAAMDDLEVTAPIPASCPHDFGPWSDPDCPEPTWVRAVVEKAGFQVTGDTGSALEVANGDEPGFSIWAFTPDTDEPPWDRGFEQVLADENYEWWRGWGTDVYFDGTRVVWFDAEWDLVVYLSATLDELPSEDVVEAVVRASLQVEYDAIDTRG